jgi:ABC-type dipeptide/oligopeptide/nickel transport system permease component
LGMFWATEQMTRRELIEQLNEELEAMRRAKGLDTKDKD